MRPRFLPASRQLEKRLDAAVAKALQLANGLVLVAVAGGEEQLFSSSMACPDCGLDVPKLEPRSFSFNSAFGACPECHGLGSLYDLDPAKVITDWSKPLLDGLGPGSTSQYLLKLINLAADRYKIDLKTPFEELPPRQQHLLVYGPPKGEGPRTGFHGILDLPARQHRRGAQRFLSRVDDELYVRHALPRLPRQAPAPGVAGGQDRRPLHRRLHRPAAQPRALGGHQPQLHGAPVAHCRAHPPRDRRAAGVSLRRGPHLPFAGPQRRHALAAARGSASASPRRSAPGCAACSTFSTSLPSAFISATTTG